MLLKSRATEEFDIETIGTDDMDSWISECISIYKGNPLWLDEEDHIDTVNFAKAICSETARLATLGIGIHVDGSARAKWLQEQIDAVYFQLRHWVEYGCAYGTIILKPNGGGIDLYTRGKFDITHETNGVIDGVVFYNKKRVGKKWFTRLEYHRFVGDQYVITNKCFIGESENDTGKAIDISLTPWSDLMEEVAVSNIDKPLFGVLRTPQANNIDLNSPYSLPIFSEAIQAIASMTGNPNERLGTKTPSITSRWKISA